MIFDTKYLWGALYQGAEWETLRQCGKFLREFEGLVIPYFFWLHLKVVLVDL